MRLVIVSVTLVVVFAVIFTWGDAAGMWPEAPPRIFQNADLIAGFIFIAAIILASVRMRRRDRAD